MKTLVIQEKTPITKLAWIGWLPLVVGTSIAVTQRGELPPWGFMWLLAVVIFGGFKWWTWWRVLGGGTCSGGLRSFAYLLLWPGMNARCFLTPVQSPLNTPMRAWVWALTKTIFGAVLIWVLARQARNGLLAGWIGMVGLIFVMHFGIFALLALFWRRCGIAVEPLMNCPVAADSLSDFWGKRWNSGFRDIVFGLFFIRLARQWGTISATMLIFLFSGLVHDLVITVPARGGYGLPTLYFALQGLAMLLERSATGKRWGLVGGWKGRAFTILIVALPAYALFPPPFVLRVMVPFLQLIGALP